MFLGSILLSLCFALSGDNVECDEVIHEAPRFVNSNSNAASRGKYAMNLEMPRMNINNIYISHDTVVAGRKVHNYSYEWNKKLCHAQWVAFRSDRQNAVNNKVGRTVSGNFLTDWLLSCSPEESAHKHDGFDKGHMLPSGDRQSDKELNFQTFYLTNMSPMEHNFNSGFWTAIENQCRKWCRNDIMNARWDTVYQVRGGNLAKLRRNYTSNIKGQDGKYPTADAKGLSKGGIAVPAYYFVAILARKGEKFQAIAFYVEHDPTLPLRPSKSQLKEKVVSIKELEKLTGIDFFCNLEDHLENEVEGNVDLSVWTW